MKTLKKIIVFAFIIALFTTCKKEQLPPNTTLNQPVFSFTGSIANNNNISWQAGVNNYYMYSSFSQNDSTGVYSFNGTLRSTATANNSIQFIINDYKTSALNASVAPHINTSLSITAPYYYNTGIISTIIDTTGYTVTLTPVVYFGVATSFTYSWGDLTANTVSASDTPVSHKYTTLGNYATSLKVHFSSCGTTDTVANSLNLGSLNPLIINSVTSTSGTNTGDSVPYTLTANATGGIPPYTYAWKFGNGDTSNSNPGVSPFDTATHTTYSNLVIVTDKLGNTANYNYVLYANRSTPACLFSYSMSKPKVDTTKTTNAAALSDITIIYTDGGGNIYTSKNPTQPSASSFKVLSVSDYQNNINNNPTKMLKITFSCLLYNGVNAISASGTAIIAVAYK